ncbi:hypothetical protein [Rhodopseudomonas palustris]|uniref:Proteophosphoglycan ppg4 n=1 Tax=Rhodopseudomonas palustris (strain BisB18) TaxID=316056 RepID=Q21C16_RHOPB
MKIKLIATATALALFTTLAAAQPSQPQGGANTGPTSNSANSRGQDMNQGTVGTSPATPGTGNSLSPGSGLTGSPHPSAQSNVGGNAGTGNSPR